MYYVLKYYIERESEHFPLDQNHKSTGMGINIFVLLQLCN